MATDNVNSYDADEEIEFAISMAAMLRTAARAADEFGVSCRELARRFAEQVDADQVPDADPAGLPIGLAFREVYQQGHVILATLYERWTAADPAIDRQAEIGIELMVTPSTCKYCPGLLLWTRDDAGKPLPLDPRPFPALAKARSCCAWPGEPAGRAACCTGVEVLTTAIHRRSNGATVTGGRARPGEPDGRRPRPAPSAT
jgi:hypothetical protein